MAYVAVSRGQWDAQIFTNDRGALVNALGRDVSHKSAHAPEQTIAPTMGKSVDSPQKRELDIGMGLGLGM
jgi:hypothetical protein